MFSYLIRHWRGELPLAIAWWINGIAITVLTVLLEINAARSGLADAISSRAGFTLFLAAGMALLLLLPAWQVIGIFRAADRHAEQAGTILAARLTQVLTTVFAVLLATRFLIFAGEAAGGARLAYSLDGPGYSIVVSHGGRMLEVHGGFLFGLAEDARQVLDKNPGVRRVRLNSGGGSLIEAQRLRSLILERGLDTDSSTGCSSACVSAYIAGQHRLLRRSARLGFHLPRNPGFGQRNPVSPDYATEMGYFMRQGVPLWFQLRWIANGRTFWYPNPRQLQAAGFVHAFFGMPRPGESGYFL